MLNELIKKLAVPQAVEMEFGGIPAKRLSAGYSTSQCPENQVINFVFSTFRVKVEKKLVEN